MPSVKPPGHRRPFAELAVGDREFRQRERITRRLVEQPGAYRIRKPRSAGVQQLGGRRCGQRFEMQRRQFGFERTVVAVQDRSDQQDRFEFQPPRDECQHITRGAVEPLSIVRGHEHRGLCRALGKQVQRGQRRQEEVRREPISQPERHSHRVALRRRQPVQVAEDRPQQLVQPGERKQGLGLHAGGLQNQHSAIRGARGSLQQECRLSDAGTPGHRQ
jgi:hypothetical protein